MTRSVAVALAAVALAALAAAPTPARGQVTHLCDANKAELTDQRLFWFDEEGRFVTDVCSPAQGDDCDAPDFVIGTTKYFDRGSQGDNADKEPCDWDAGSPSGGDPRAAPCGDLFPGGCGDCGICSNVPLEAWPGPPSAEMPEGWQDWNPPLCVPEDEYCAAQGAPDTCYPTFLLGQSESKRRLDADVAEMVSKARTLQAGLYPPTQWICLTDL
mmetsp:Transcript_11857/g.41590  ORF Transcript_11857/g.41590 Transcript_11857/m.41590 type:complete len:214 (-) Transcript_11857:79-720(-)